MSSFVRVARRCRGWTGSGVGGQETASSRGGWSWDGWGTCGVVWFSGPGDWTGLDWTAAPEGAQEHRTTDRSTTGRGCGESVRKGGQGRARVRQGRAGQGGAYSVLTDGSTAGALHQGFLHSRLPWVGLSVLCCTRRDNSSSRATSQNHQLSATISRHFLGVHSQVPKRLPGSRLGIMGGDDCLCAWPPPL